MNLFTYFRVELMKIRRSRISWILFIPTLMMWLPSAFNADINFKMNTYGVSPEHNYFIQGYMGMSWFMLPATLVICTVLLNQTERTNNGILKCLALPIDTIRLSFAKFFVIVLLTFEQLILSIAAYYASAVLASWLYEYDFILPFPYVCRVASLIYLAALPMAAVFWMLSIVIQTPIFSVGLGLASIVPSVLLLNTKFWYCYPMDYPFYMLMTEYGKIATEIFTTEVQLIPLLPVGILIIILSLLIAGLRFSAAERK